MPKYKKFIRRARRYAPYLARAARGAFNDNFNKFYYGAAATGAAHAHLRGRSQRKHATSGRGVTVQHDRRQIYRKHRMPRRKRKQWKSFVRKVNAAAEKDLGSVTIVRNETKTMTNTAETLEQAAEVFALYSVKNTNGWLNDLGAIAANISSTDNTVKHIFKSAVLDMTIENRSLDAAEGGTGFTVELDIYEISSSSSWNHLTGTNKALLNVFTAGFTETGTEGSGTGLNFTQRGVTPWDCPQALSAYKVKIWKKTKFFLSYGNSITYQIRDPRRHVLDQETMTTWDSSNMPGMTRWVLILAKPTPGTTMGTGGQVAIPVGVTRKYLYKHNEDSVDADAFI